MKMLSSVHLRNFLSFGPDASRIPLRDVNVLIGPNGSGKSNFLEALVLMQASSGLLSSPIREGGGVRDWLWKGSQKLPNATLEIVLEPSGILRVPLRYSFQFTDVNNRFEIRDERIENELPFSGEQNPYFYYRYQDNHPVLNVKTQNGDSSRRNLKREDIDPEKSILAQRRDPDSYPEISFLGDSLANIRVYRDWAFGRSAPARAPQPADLPNKWLDYDGQNLALVLSRIKKNYPAKEKILDYFRAINENVFDFDENIEAGKVQIFVQEKNQENQEKNFTIPATRLSDGTLRYLFLLTILCDPNPPPLICIDEPELGLHPDLIGKVADAIKDAAERTQVIVTTHSASFVDAFTDDPESILVCEKHDGCTEINRLDGQRLTPWLERYRLGDLWTSGEIGGNRW